jgi:hypothetical protein
LIPSWTVVEVDHRDALEIGGIGMAELDEPVVVRAKDGHGCEKDSRRGNSTGASITRGVAASVFKDEPSFKGRIDAINKTERIAFGFQKMTTRFQHCGAD